MENGCGHREPDAGCEAESRRRASASRHCGCPRSVGRPLGDGTPSGMLDDETYLARRTLTDRALSVNLAG